MFTSKKKIGNDAGTIKSTDRLTRLLRSDIDLQASRISLVLAEQEDSRCESSQPVGNAMLDAEYKRAIGTVAMQQHRSFG